MTVLTANIRDIGGVDDQTMFTFEIPTVRESAGGGVVTVRSCRYTATGGVLTTDDLEPGPAVLRLSGSATGDYHITIPVSDTPVQLWPLIDAATPPPPEAVWGTGFMRNAGGLARGAAMPLSAYPDAVKDPETIYILF